MNEHRNKIKFYVDIFSAVSFGEIRNCLNQCTFQYTNLVKQDHAKFSAQYIHSLKLSQDVLVKYIRMFNKQLLLFQHTCNFFLAFIYISLK